MNCSENSEWCKATHTKENLSPTNGISAQTQGKHTDGLVLGSRRGQHTIQLDFQNTPLSRFLLLYRPHSQNRLKFQKQTLRAYTLTMMMTRKKKGKQTAAVACLKCIWKGTAGCSRLYTAGTPFQIPLSTTFERRKFNLEDKYLHNLCVCAGGGFCEWRREYVPCDS